MVILVERPLPNLRQKLRLIHDEENRRYYVYSSRHNKSTGPYTTDTPAKRSYNKFRRDGYSSGEYAWTTLDKFSLEVNVDLVVKVAAVKFCQLRAIYGFSEAWSKTEDKLWKKCLLDSGLFLYGQKYIDELIPDQEED